MSRIRVLHIEGGKNLYGGPYQVLSLMRLLRKSSDVQNLLACPHGSAIAIAAEEHQLPVHTIPLRGDGSVGAYFALRRIIDSWKPDIVHVHSRRGADVWGVLAAARSKRRLIVTRRVDNPEPKVLVKFRYAAADIVVGISEEICRVMRAGGVSTHKIRCIRSGVDTQEWRPDAQARRWIEEQFGVQTDEKLVVMAAQFIPRKGHEMLLRAIPAVVKAQPRTRFLLLGKGPLLEKVREEAKPFGERVLVPGFRDDFNRILPGCDVLAHPAQMEGLGVVILQAAACAVPVVAGRAGGIPEVVRDGETGYLVDPLSPEQIAQKLVRLLTDADLRNRIGMEARRLAEKELSTEAMAEGNLALYRELMKGEGRK